MRLFQTQSQFADRLSSAVCCLYITLTNQPLLLLFVCLLRKNHYCYLCVCVICFYFHLITYLGRGGIFVFFSFDALSLSLSVICSSSQRTIVLVNCDPSLIK